MIAYVLKEIISETDKCRRHYFKTMDEAIEFWVNHSCIQLPFPVSLPDERRKD